MIPSREMCFQCDDLGVVRVISREEPIESLMLCDCEEGRDQRYALPRWEYNLGRLYRREKCPLSWFKPDMVVVAPGREMKLQETIASKVEYWRAKIAIAEEFWEHAKKLNKEVS